ncbi:hypothetical protein [Fluviicola sp.]|uniref:hypothetical protein n=1 Tax=Fluviicola sp. TaxID=1917219 RepID=UPI002629D19F|nr:hypothetical protein [Fluviicola sp.]
MNKLILIFSLSIIVIFSCKKETEAPKTALIEVVKNSPETIAIGNNVLTLNTSLWRDFMPGPGAPENGSSLYCLVEVKNSQNLDLREHITLKRVYVINGNELWNSVLTEQDYGFEHIVAGSANEGPLWGPDLQVDVVCEFEYNGVIRRMIAKSQNIDMTM